MFNQSTSLQDAVKYAEMEYEKLNLEQIKSANVYLNVFEYYLMGTYPPLKAMKPITVAEFLSNQSGVYNLYIHIPFCKQLCTFCHFAKEINAKNERINNYLTALRKEIDLVAQHLNSDTTPKIKTIFFGGGTPSILQPSQIKELFEHLYAVFDIEKNAEITYELHPGLVRQEDYEERVQMLIKSGVNRWVSGVQSMDDKILKKLNRGHTSAEVYRLIEILRKNGVDNLSLDLMYGLPYQTLDNWYFSIISLLEAGVEKYNVFPLMFKMSDPITLHYVKEPEIFPSERDRFLMHYIAEYIFSQYDYNSGPIFYYSKTEVHSKQQKSKFEEIEEVNLLGLGVSSFGYVGDTQYYNQLDIDSYILSINNNQLPIFMGSTLELDERRRRNIMFALRSDGINISNYVLKFGQHPVEHFPSEFGLLYRLNLAEEESGYIKLTKRGLIFADGIGLLFVSDNVKELVKNTNCKEYQFARDSVLDRYDFSPIARLDYKEAQCHFPKISKENL